MATGAIASMDLPREASRQFGKRAAFLEGAIGTCGTPYLNFLLDAESKLDDTTPIRQRGVTGFPGGRLFAIFEGSGFWCCLDSIADKLIRIYGKTPLHAQESS
jgi:hypothetical protein